ncbi:hypothetical protein CAPTEDRAFT_216278 [Capitella teleta]|uniref:Uncharacterized protein n=1 Tax=Capitella teleta TaxID=283909 RepID=R7VLP3_CAPTE|nr:hypothetical protein CAPTEDRAFT_216278 [Capitella teleta]|eukprot:ELU17770.1 hypothetical protein CAPTEDRAFT_216278 [Capitella teleta]
MSSNERPCMFIEFPTTIYIAVSQSLKCNRVYIVEAWHPKDNETDEVTNSGLENSISSALERDISAVNTSTNDQTEATLISDADNVDIQFGFLEDQEAENIQATEAVLENSASISNNGEINQYVNANNIQMLILRG